MSTFRADKFEVEILYEDKNVIAFVKPAGLLSQKADGTNEDSVLEYLDAYFNGKSKAYPVHRLDRTTGGVMVVAKNPRAAAALSTLASGDGMKKEYLAAVHGTPTGGRLEDMLYFDRRKNKSFVVKSDRRGVKRAVLEYETLSSCDGYSIVKIRLMTGRTHQIRVQMSHAGHPLLGDGKYGGRDNKCSCPLWSHRITFDHTLLEETSLGGSAFSKSLSADPDLLISSPSGYPWDSLL